MRTRRYNWTFDWLTAEIKVSEFGRPISYDRGQVVRFTKYYRGVPTQAHVGRAVAAIRRGADLAASRGTVGRTENVRFIEGGRMPKPKRKPTLEQRVAWIEGQLQPRRAGEYFSSFDEKLADRVVSCQRRLSDIEARIGDPGVPRYVFRGRLDGGQSVRVVARYVDEALAKVQAWQRQQEHKGAVVSVEKDIDEPIDVC